MNLPVNGSFDGPGEGRNISDGWVIRVELTPPSLGDNTGDADRLLRALGRRLASDHVRLDLPLLRELPALIRSADYRLRAVVFREPGGWVVAGLTPGAAPGLVAGLALDLGTTRMAARLVDLESGAILAETALDNPQLEIGPDVLARIHHAATEGGLEQLNMLALEGVNYAIRKLCRSAGIAMDSILLAAVAGNTAMTHLFLGLDPRWIIREPYIPAANRPDPIRAGELGLAMHPMGRVFVFPNVGAYFGGDLIAGILYADLDRADRISMLVDVGTNAEVALGGGGWMVACAGAAGPALEGGVTRMGAMAGPGVIDRVAIDPLTRRFSIHTIGDEPARGICGSGLIDLAAQLFRAGMVDIRGRFLPETLGDRLRVMDETRHLIVVPAAESATGEDLTLSQIDMDSLIRSKAAMFTILETLSATVGLTPSDIERFYVAGTFGAFIDPESAISIGMIPDLDRDRFVSLGNSSLGGAVAALLSRDSVDRINAIRDGITYVELNVNQEFMNRFSAARFLPHTDPARFPSVSIPRR